MRMAQKSRPKAHPAVSDTVEVGYISGVFGTRGEVKVYLHNPDSGLFKSRLSCLLVSESGPPQSAVLSVRSGAGKKIIGRFDICTTRNIAESVVGCKIVVVRSALPELDEDEFYISDLEQMQVVSPLGKTVGVVVGVHQTGRGDMLEIHQKEEVFFVPLSDPFVDNIDIGQKILVLSDTGMECL